MAFVLALGITGCLDDSKSDPPIPITASQVIRDLSGQVILATYSDLAVKSDSMVAVIRRLVQNPNALNLASAQQAWRDARVPWELSEGFLFGPVVNLPIDEVIDTWPLNEVDLDNVLKSNDSLTKAYVDALNFNLKGFHTLEYLLFGDTANASAVVRYPDSLTVRQLDYLHAVAASLAGETHRLLAAWDSTGGNYIREFQTAGKGSATYLSEQQAVAELVEGMFFICDEVAGSKIFNPYKRDGVPNRDYEESRFSNNSMADFADNIRSVRNVYQGSYQGNTGHGLKKLLETKNPLLAAEVERQIDSAVNAVTAMGIFGDAIFNDGPRVDAAIEAVLTLRASLACRVDSILAQSGPCAAP